MAIGIALSLVVALAGAIWFLVANSQQKRRTREATGHVFRGQGETVTVAELIEDAAERGEGIRLNWSGEDFDEAGQVRPYAQDQFPTVILPKIDGFGDKGR